MNVRLVFDRAGTSHLSGKGLLEFYIYWPDRKRKRYISTKIRIRPEEWDERSGLTINETVNYRLLSMKKEIIDAGGKEWKKEVPVFFNSFVLKEISTDVTKRLSTYNDHLSTLNKLNTYCQDIKFSQLTPAFIQGFIDYLKENYQSNTVWKHVKNLRTYIHIAYKRGLITQRPDLELDEIKYRDSKIKVYLTAGELDDLENVLVISGNSTVKETWNTILDGFLFCCYTGLRISDINIRKDDVQKHGDRHYIHKITKKTLEPVVIPLSRKAVAILEKHDYNLSFGHYDNVNINDIVKTLCKQANINSKIEFAELVDGEVIRRVVEKWELVTFHTSRRTALTLMYLNGLKPVQIMKISGHRSEMSLMKYLSVTSLENATAICDNPFFT